MAFRLPTFNLWGRAWRPIGTGPTIEETEWVFDGYFRCQMRTVDQHYATQFSLEVERGMPFRPFWQTPFNHGFRVQLAGWEYVWATVFYVTDVGAGFANEHRTLVCGVGADDSWFSEYGMYLPRVNKDLQPPEDALMMEAQGVFDGWELPDMNKPYWSSAW